MFPEIQPQSFLFFAFTSIVLCLNLSGLWLASGALRGKYKAPVNPEDSKAGVGTPEEKTPDAIARILRAHGNAQANIIPFLILGLVFVLAGGSPLATKIFCGIFVVARLLHSYCYLAAKQPWRTITFLVGLLTTVGLMIAIGVQVAPLMG